MLARQEVLALAPPARPFGQLLRRYRQAAGLSQEQLAERAGLSVEAVNTLERGTRRAPRPDTIARLAAALRLSGLDRTRLEAAVVRARPRAVADVTAASRRLPALPIPLTSFIGREEAIAAVRRLLDTARLLTLIGAPGTGKTRLALAVAAAVGGAYPDGVAFVPLSTVVDPDLVLLTIAQTLRLVDQAGEPVLERLQAALQRRRMLLLLDNVEQVADAAPDFVELLRRCPGVTALVTSRVVLRASGEQVYIVPPLQLPAPDVTDVERLVEVDAIRLFLERARALAPEFAPTGEQAAAVADICRRLDGLPLAIELAAARVRLVPPVALLRALDQGVPLLSGGARDRPERHRTLDSAITWSYDLLTPDVRRAFRHLAAFAGGFTAAAAEAVAFLSPVSVLDSLGALLDASMVLPQVGPDDTPRFALLHTLREFALARLDAEGEGDAAHSRHAAYFLMFVEQAEPELRGHRQLAVFALLEQERANLRAAHAWLVARGHAGDRAAAAEAVRLVGVQWWFWYVRGWWTEGRRQIAQALALAGAEEPTAGRAKALHGLAVLSWLQDSDAAVEALLAESARLFQALGDEQGGALVRFHQVTARRPDAPRATEEHLEEALARFRAAKDRWGTALALCYLARIAYWLHGDPAQARRLFDESLALFRFVGDRWGILTALHSAGSALIGQGAFAAALPLLAESLTLAREFGHQPQVARSLDLLAALHEECGEEARAAALCTEALDLHRELNSRAGTAECLYQCGDLAYDQGEYSRAQLLYEQCLNHWHAMGAGPYMANAHLQLAFVALELHDPTTAVAHFDQARAQAGEPLPSEHEAWLLDGYACLAVLAGQGERACRLAGAAAALRRQTARAMARHEQHRMDRWLQPVRQSLAEAAAEAWAAGQAMTADQALTFALETTC